MYITQKLWASSLLQYWSLYIKTYNGFEKPMMSIVKLHIQTGKPQLVESTIYRIRRRNLHIARWLLFYYVL